MIRVEESNDKECCSACDKYGYLFEIRIGDNEWPELRLCKKCLLELMKAIIER